MRVQIMKKLGEVMYTRSWGKSFADTYEAAKKLLDQIFIDYKNEVEFLRYFKTTWMGKIGMSL